MAENNENVEQVEGTTSEVQEAVEDTPRLSVVAQEAKLVGEEAEQPREPTAAVTKGEVPAQVAQPRESDADTVNVHEVVVVTDEVITDPSDPRAVQVPEAGRGDLSLPIHALAGPRVEDVFAAQASEQREVSDEEREASRAEGRSAAQTDES